MESNVEFLLSELAKTCPNPALSPIDWDRLYVLAMQVHGQRGAPDVPAIRKFLVSKGCSVHKAAFFSRQVESFCRLLCLYDEEMRKGTRSES